jgi:DNA-damage-inducible protein J
MIEMAKTLTLHTRIEPEIKDKADAILKELGISTTEAINLFLRQVIRYRGIPLDLRIPNDETAAAVKEAEQGVDLHRCKDLEQLFKELKED